QLQVSYPDIALRPSIAIGEFAFSGDVSAGRPKDQVYSWFIRDIEHRAYPFTRFSLLYTYLAGPRPATDALNYSPPQEGYWSASWQPESPWYNGLLNELGSVTGFWQHPLLRASYNIYIPLAMSGYSSRQVPGINAGIASVTEVPAKTVFPSLVYPGNSVFMVVAVAGVFGSFLSAARSIITARVRLLEVLLLSLFVFFELMIIKDANSIFTLSGGPVDSISQISQGLLAASPYHFAFVEIDIALVCLAVIEIGSVIFSKSHRGYVEKIIRGSADKKSNILKIACMIFGALAFLVLSWPIQELIHQTTHTASAMLFGSPAEFTRVYLAPEIGGGVFQSILPGLYGILDPEQTGMFGARLFEAAMARYSVSSFPALIIVRIAPNVLFAVAALFLIKAGILKKSLFRLILGFGLASWPAVFSVVGDYALASQFNMPTGLAPDWMVQTSILNYSIDRFILLALVWAVSVGLFIIIKQGIPAFWHSLSRSKKKSGSSLLMCSALPLLGASILLNILPLIGQLLSALPFSFWLLLAGLLFVWLVRTRIFPRMDPERVTRVKTNILGILLSVISLAAVMLLVSFGGPAGIVIVMGLVFLAVFAMVITSRQVVSAIVSVLLIVFLMTLFYAFNNPAGFVPEAFGCVFVAFITLMAAFSLACRHEAARDRDAADEHDHARSSRALTPEENAELADMLSAHLSEIAISNPVYTEQQERAVTVLEELGYRDLAEILRGSIVIDAPPALESAIQEFQRKHNLLLYALNVTYRETRYIIVHNERELERTLVHEASALAGNSDNQNRKLEDLIIHRWSVAFPGDDVSRLVNEEFLQVSRFVEELWQMRPRLWDDFGRLMPVLEDALQMRVV
ncbi:MAG: hypothetical protein WC547_11310, partial [Candidatus Omnitrophota bacterium]